MKPVSQTLPNNCFAACLASLLELECDKVPNFVGQENRGNWSWLEDCYRWLKQRGFGLLLIDEKDSSYWIRGEAPCIFSVASPRNKNGRHAVIGTWIDDKPVILHDPWPDKDGRIKEIDKVYFSYYLISIRPEKLLLTANIPGADAA